MLFTQFERYKRRQIASFSNILFSILVSSISILKIISNSVFWRTHVILYTHNTVPQTKLVAVGRSVKRRTVHRGGKPLTGILQVFSVASDAPQEYSVTRPSIQLRYVVSHPLHLINGFLLLHSSLSIQLFDVTASRVQLWYGGHQDRQVRCNITLDIIREGWT